MKTPCYLLLLLLAGKSFGQPIEIRNPSFETDNHQSAATPSGWYDCGNPHEALTDIQPVWDIYLAAAEGNNFLSLVVRDNNTTQAIGQELSQPLEKDSFYVLTLSVARTLVMTLPDARSAEKRSYATPATLKIWGGNGPCDKEELLATSTVISNTDWREIQLRLKPAVVTTHIIIEAYHKTPILFPYNGNVLIDNLRLTQIP